MAAVGNTDTAVTAAIGIEPVGIKERESVVGTDDTAAALAELRVGSAETSGGTALNDATEWMLATVRSM